MYTLCQSQLVSATETFWKSCPVKLCPRVCNDVKFTDLVFKLRAVINYFDINIRGCVATAIYLQSIADSKSMLPAQIDSYFGSIVMQSWSFKQTCIHAACHIQNNLNFFLLNETLMMRTKLLFVCVCVSER